MKQSKAVIIRALFMQNYPALAYVTCIILSKTEINKPHAVHTVVTDTGMVERINCITLVAPAETEIAKKCYILHK